MLYRLLVTVTLIPVTRDGPSAFRDIVTPSGARDVLGAFSVGVMNSAELSPTGALELVHGELVHGFDEIASVIPTQGAI